MQITHQADYAIRAILFLAQKESDARVATSEIATAYAIPPSFLTKIISQLSIAGIIHTSRGARGGVSLARPASQISVLDVLEAIDGPITLNQCVNDPSICCNSKECLIHVFWVETCADFVDRLRNTTFENLLEKRLQTVAA